MTATELLRRNRTVLALHLLRPARVEAPPLLRLHALGDRAVTTRPLGLEGWPGAVWGLDFTGHGASSRPVGGGYSPEGLAADADVALGHLGRCVVVGWGLGGYVGLLLAGARPASVQGLVIAAGHGLEGADLDPAVVHVVEHPPPPLPAGQVPDGTGSGAPAVDATTDPYAWAELQLDARSGPYALGYLERALAARPAAPAAVPQVVVAVGTRPRPRWLAAVEAHPAVVGGRALGLPAGADDAALVAAALARLTPR